MPSCSGPNAISSRTVGENTCASEFWKMNPTRERKPIENCSSSQVVLGHGLAERLVAYPQSGKIRPSRTFSSVDLPQPLAPSSATFSPRPTSNDTPSSAGKRSR